MSGRAAGTAVYGVPELDVRILTATYPGGPKLNKGFRCRRLYTALRWFSESYDIRYTCSLYLPAESRASPSAFASRWDAPRCKRSVKGSPPARTNRHHVQSASGGAVEGHRCWPPTQQETGRVWVCQVNPAIPPVASTPSLVLSPQLDRNIYVRPSQILKLRVPH